MYRLIRVTASNKKWLISKNGDKTTWDETILTLQKTITTKKKKKETARKYMFQDIVVVVAAAGAATTTPDDDDDVYCVVCGDAVEQVEEKKKVAVKIHFAV